MMAPGGDKAGDGLVYLDLLVLVVRCRRKEGRVWRMEGSGLYGIGMELWCHGFAAGQCCRPGELVRRTGEGIEERRA